MKNKCIKAVSSLCTKMALSVSASACAMACYQPKEPKALRK